MSESHATLFHYTINTEFQNLIRVTILGPGRPVKLEFPIMQLFD